MIRRFLLLFFFVLTSRFLSAAYFTITGKVTNASIEPIENVNIKIAGTVFGTSTDANGNYVLQLEKGNYEIVFTHLGYLTIKKNITLTNNIIVNTILEEDVNSLKEVELTTKRVDRSREIIREVIERKEKYIELSYSCTMYIKAVQEPEEAKKKHRKDSAEKAQKKFAKDSLIKVQESDSNTKAFKRKRERDSLEWLATKDTSSKEYKKRLKELPPINPFLGIDLNFAELIIEKNFEYPDKIKEIRQAFQKKGDVQSLFYLTSTDGEFNFYQNLIRISSLSESPFQSPISNGGLLVYKYRLVKSRVENGLKIYTIKVSPNIIGNALVTGEMEIIDSLWCIKSFHFSFPKYHLAEYDEFTADAQFAPDSSGLWLCTKQEFNFKTKLGGNKSSGRTVVYYSEYAVKKFNKKFFNDELSSTSTDAYEKDSGFWNTQRKEPLSSKEVRFIYVSDSVKAAHLKTEYLDSLDRIENRITFLKVLLFGQSRYNRVKEQRISFDPAWIIVNPISIGGPRLRYGIAYYKKFKSKTNVYCRTNLSYGVLNNDLKGNVYISRLYDPYRQGFWNINAKRDFDVINTSDLSINLFRRANFYINTGVSGFHSIELFNGFTFAIGVEYGHRNSIAGYKFVSSFDSAFENYRNPPAAFNDYNAFYSDLVLSYTPFQKYLREPKEKIILGSKFPTLSVQWRKGIPGIFNSSINFDYLEYRFRWDFKLGLVGNSKLYITSGKFYNTKNLPYIDYKFQNSIGFHLFGNPLYMFQGLDSNYITLNRFYTLHYLHRFNGAILNKIPFLKLLQLNECAGGGILYSKEHNLFYFEMFAGIDRPFVLFSERVRFGIYAVQSFSNNFKSVPQIKFTIDFYDRQNNTWSY